MGIKINELPERYQRQIRDQLATTSAVSRTIANLEPGSGIPLKVKKKDCFPKQCLSAGFPEPIKEFEFHPTRKWKIDYAWPEKKIALEVEGGIWKQGRHTRGAGFLKDIEKYDELTIAGWRLVRTTPKQISDLSVFNLLKRIWKEDSHEKAQSRSNDSRRSAHWPEDYSPGSA